MPPDRLLLLEPRGYLRRGRGRRAGPGVAGAARRAGELHCFHHVVHNEDVVARFERLGVTFVDEPDEVPAGATVLLSAHGTAPAVRAAIERRAGRVVDAVCPLVAKVHREVVARAAAGDRILYVGRPGHDETDGVLALAPERTTLVAGAGDVAAVPVGPGEQVAVLAQTTLRVEEVEAAEAAARRRFGEVWTPPRGDICDASTTPAGRGPPGGRRAATPWWWSARAASSNTASLVAGRARRRRAAGRPGRRCRRAPRRPRTARWPSPPGRRRPTPRRRRHRPPRRRRDAEVVHGPAERPPAASRCRRRATARGGAGGGRGARPDRSRRLAASDPATTAEDLLRLAEASWPRPPAPVAGMAVGDSARRAAAPPSGGGRRRRPRRAVGRLRAGRPGPRGRRSSSGPPCPAGGPACSSVDGFRFDTGPTVLTMPDLLASTFAAAGADMDDLLTLHRLDPLYRATFADGSTIRVRSGRDAMAQELRDTCGAGVADAFDRYVRWVTELYELEMPNFIARDYDHPLDLARPHRPGASPGPAGRLPQPVQAGRPLLRRRAAPAAVQLPGDVRRAGAPAGPGPLRRHQLHGQRGRGLLPARAACTPSPSPSPRPSRRPAGSCATAPAVERIVLADGTSGRGAGRPPRRRRAGARRRRRGHAGPARGVPAAAARARPAPHGPRRGTYSPSALVRHAGVRGLPGPEVAHHNIHFGAAWDSSFRALLDDGRPMPDPSILVTVPTIDDPGHAPEGCSVLYALEPVPNLDGRRRLDHRARRRSRPAWPPTSPGLGYPDDVVVEEVVDPLDWERQGMERGTPFSLSHRFLQTGPFRPSNRRAAGTRPGVRRVGHPARRGRAPRAAVGPPGRRPGRGAGVSGAAGTRRPAGGGLRRCRRHQPGPRHDRTTGRPGCCPATSSPTSSPSTRSAGTPTTSSTTSATTPPRPSAPPPSPASATGSSPTSSRVAPTTSCWRPPWTTVRRWDIDPDCFRRFLRSMAMDLTVDRYATWDDLCGYMDGSAAVIGEMVLPILEPLDPAATEPARTLGVAFQLTNFLRDVGEDLDRGRVYLPQDDLARFGADPWSRRVTPEWEALMRFEIDRARAPLRRGRPGHRPAPGPLGPLHRRGPACSTPGSSTGSRPPATTCSPPGPGCPPPPRCGWPPRR